MTSFRQTADVRRLDVHVRYGAGTLRIQPSADGELYRVGLRYDSDAFEPIAAYDDGRLEVGVDGRQDGVQVVVGQLAQCEKLHTAVGRSAPGTVGDEQMQVHVQAGASRRRTPHPRVAYRRLVQRREGHSRRWQGCRAW